MGWQAGQTRLGRQKMIAQLARYGW
ncbi:hypothetical protein CABS01_14346 [Colletotrichum abscissum]|uniref:Uncharacterized protein n=1 Tax=Colletotrichum tamarilloi TaxID=1209934 RepID=A0ABQ9RAW9_9PEZI|nr:hypothetical protein CABS01_14346 [Colletotrichum abscissum]KAK1500101.1 hypothetical protein CTAM01_06700 [Colletotrichum tamarilloi]